jgi:purine-binding chemotaxis protein CheW
MTDEKQFFSFFVGGYFFGVDVGRVREVICDQELTPVPLAHAVVEGLMNLRGRIVTTIDLRRRLGLPERGADDIPYGVVIESTGELVCLLVDAVEDVLTVSQDAFEVPPETLDPAAREMIIGTYQLPEVLLLVLDSDKVLVLPETGARSA